MITKERFLKKADKHLNHSWRFFKRVSDLSLKEKKVFFDHNILDFDHLVLVHFQDALSWFIVSISGIYLFKNHKLKFIKYKEIIGTEVIIDFRKKNPKLEANTLRLKLYCGTQIDLTCLDEGAVYSLSSIVNFGIWASNKKNNLAP